MLSWNQRSSLHCRAFSSRKRVARGGCDGASWISVPLSGTGIPPCRPSREQDWGVWSPILTSILMLSSSQSRRRQRNIYKNCVSHHTCVPSQQTGVAVTLVVLHMRVRLRWSQCPLVRWRKRQRVCYITLAGPFDIRESWTERREDVPKVINRDDF
jgi:hypothetical protein